MLTMLVSLPPTSSEMDFHQLRAWSFTLAIQERFHCVLTHDGQWSDSLLNEISGGIVFHSERDLETLVRLRRAKLPAFYYPSYGPLTPGGFLDTTLYEESHRLRTRLRMAAAHVTLVDSFRQAVCAQRHYQVSENWLVIPGGPHPAPPSSSSRHTPRLWAIEPMEDYAAVLHEWARDNDFVAYRSSVLETLVHLRPESDIVFSPHPAWHADTVLTWAQTDAPVVLPDSGVVDHRYRRLAWLPPGPLSLSETWRVLGEARVRPSGDPLPLPSWHNSINALMAAVERMRGFLIDR